MLFVEFVVTVRVGETLNRVLVHERGQSASSSLLAPGTFSQLVVLLADRWRASPSALEAYRDYPKVDKHVTGAPVTAIERLDGEDS